MPPVTPDNPFTAMQRAVYARDAARWSPAARDPVVGAFDAHNAWADYDLLFAGLDTAGTVGLDFGCGPGRNLVRHAARFARLDGADLDPTNLANAARWCAANGVPTPVLYLTDGVSLGGVPPAAYAVVLSTICLQHIPVRAIRCALFAEFARVLRPGGWVTAQMGFGDAGDPRGVPYHADAWDASATNGGCDVVVTDPAAVRADLEAAGLTGFRHRVRPAGPNDWHPQWIFFQARKDA